MSARSSSAFSRLCVIGEWASRSKLDPLTDVVELPVLQWDNCEIAELSRLVRMGAPLHDDNRMVGLHCGSYVYVPKHLTLCSGVPTCAPCYQCSSASTLARTPHQPPSLPFLLIAQVTTFVPPNKSRVYVDVFGSAPEFFIRSKTFRSSTCPFSFDWLGFFAFCAPSLEDVLPCLKKVEHLPDFRGIVVVPTSVSPSLVSFKKPTFVLSLKNYSARYYVDRADVPNTNLEHPTLEFKSDFPFDPIPRERYLPWLCLAPHIGSLRGLLHSVIAGFTVGRSLRLCRYELDWSPVMPPPYPLDSRDREAVDEYDNTCIAKGFVLPLAVRTGSSLPFSNTRIAPKFVNYRRLDNKPRVIVDHSATNTNVGSWVDGFQRNTSRNAICQAVSDAGYGTLIVTTDVVGAYKNVRLAPFDFPFVMERCSSRSCLLLELVHQWGSRAAGFAWEPAARLFRLFITIIIVVLACHYVDDYTILIPGSFDYPRARQVVALLSFSSQLLGLRLSKWQMGAKVNVLGLNLNLWSGICGIPERRWNLCVEDVKVLLSLSSCSAARLSSIAGSLVYFTLVFSSARPFLPILFRAIASRVQKAGWRALIRIPVKLKDHLSKLLKKLSTSSGDMNLYSSLYLRHTPEYIYTDASIIGLGIVFCHPLFEMVSIPLTTALLNRYFVETRVSIPGLEALAITLAVLMRCASFNKPRRIHVFTDSEVFIAAWSKGYSSAPLLQEAIVWLLSACEEFDVDLSIAFIPTSVNPADFPSKNFFPPSHTHFEHFNSLQDICGGRALAVSTRSFPAWALRWMNLEYLIETEPV